MKKTIIIALCFLTLGSLFLLRAVHSQSQPPTVDYQGQPIVDHDLDGLTDEGEKQIYHTDSNNPDSDGDGFNDGVEAVSGTDPTDAQSFPGKPIPLEQTKIETPWAWYVSRSSALMSFVLLWISIFLGLAIHTPLLDKIIKPAYSYGSHCFISLLALLFALFHGVALMFDEAINFSLAGVFIPFAASYEPSLVALGTLAFYLMLLLVVTSYAKKFVPQKMWRIVHTTNIILYAIGIVHALLLGTDLKSGAAREIFIWANAFLIFLFLVNIEARLVAYFKSKSLPAE